LKNDPKGRSSGVDDDPRTQGIAKSFLAEASKYTTRRPQGLVLSFAVSESLVNGDVR